MKKNIITPVLLVSVLAVSLVFLSGCKKEKTPEAEALPEAELAEETAFSVMQGTYTNTKAKEILAKENDPIMQTYLLSSILDYKNTAERHEELLADKSLELETAIISGQVTDMKSAPLSDVEVYLLNRDETVMTDENGQFTFESEVIVPQIVKIRAKKRGYFTMVNTVDLYNADQYKPSAFKLMPAEAVTVEVEPGKPVDVQYKAGSVAIPADAIVREAKMDKTAGLVNTAFAQEDETITGTITVEMAYLSPDDFEANPELNGVLRAILKNEPSYELDENTEWSNVTLGTYGMVDVNLYQGDEKLQLKEGEMAELAIKVPENMKEDFMETFDIGQDGKTQNAFWYLNEEKGVWENYPDGVYDPETNEYTASVPHFSPHNLDWYNSFWLVPYGCPAMEDSGTVVVQLFGSRNGEGAFVFGQGIYTQNGSYSITGPVATYPVAISCFIAPCDDVPQGIRDSSVAYEWCETSQDVTEPERAGRVGEVVTFTDVGTETCWRPCEE